MKSRLKIRVESAVGTRNSTCMHISIVDGAVPRMSYRRTVYTVEETAKAESLRCGDLQMAHSKPTLQTPQVLLRHMQQSRKMGRESLYNT